MSANIQWRLISRPQGEVRRENFEIRRTDKPVPGPNEILVRNLYLFVPPSMRLWMDEKEGYLPPQPLGEVMYGITLGIVEESNDPALKPGTYVNGMGGCQLWFTAPAAHLVPLTPHKDISLAAYRTVLDVQGLTAYIGLTEIAKIKSGETLVVTAAAGSVGSIACQIGKRLGLKVVGIAGGAEKCAWLMKECGIDGAIDYKTEDVASRLDALVPEGVDVLFENVGGPVLDLLLDRLNQRARIAVCGLISGYNDNAGQNFKSFMEIVNKSVRMEGFLCRDYFDRMPEVSRILEGWILEGRLKYQIDTLSGLDNLVEGMSRVFHGRNHGPVVIRLSEEPSA